MFIFNLTAIVIPKAPPPLLTHMYTFIFVSISPYVCIVEDTNNYCNRYLSLPSMQT